MELSAELRLWWKGERPAEVERWFEAASAIAPGLPAERTDQYLDDPEKGELGFKLRGGARAEVKLRVAQRGAMGWLGTVEIWAKASASALRFDGPILEVRKRRRLRMFVASSGGVEELEVGEGERLRSGPAPVQGCNVEFTAVEVSGSRWWTLGLEAFGELDSVEDILKATVSALGGPPEHLSEPALRGGYPRLIAALAEDRE